MKHVYNDDDSITTTEGFYENNLEHGNQVTFTNHEIHRILRFHYGILMGIQHFRMSEPQEIFYYKIGYACIQKTSVSDSCCICYEKTNYKTLCSHSVCIRCVERTKMECPLCRRSFLGNKPN